MQCFILENEFFVIFPLFFNLSVEGVCFCQLMQKTTARFQSTGFALWGGYRRSRLNQTWVVFEVQDSSCLC